MNESKPHHNLIELRSLLNMITTEINNQYGIQGYKMVVKTSFGIGEKPIIVNKEEIKNYYSFKLILTDKTDKNKHEVIDLYTNNYKPTSFNVFMIEETAIKDFLKTSVAGLINIAYTSYVNSRADRESLSEV